MTAFCMQWPEKWELWVARVLWRLCTGYRRSSICSFPRPRQRRP
jgi:hypothetical protein